MLHIQSFILKVYLAALPSSGLLELSAF